MSNSISAPQHLIIYVTIIYDVVHLYNTQQYDIIIYGPDPKTLSVLWRLNSNNYNNDVTSRWTTISGRLDNTNAHCGSHIVAIVAIMYVLYIPTAYLGML